MKFFEDENIKYYLFPCTTIFASSGSRVRQDALLLCSISDGAEFHAEVTSCVSMDEISSLDDIDPSDWSTDIDDISGVRSDDLDFARSGLADQLRRDYHELYFICANPLMDDWAFSGDLDGARDYADDLASYNQYDIEIYDSDYNLICRRPWNGVSYDMFCSDGGLEVENPICFGDFGFYSDWE